MPGPLDATMIIGRWLLRAYRRLESETIQKGVLGSVWGHGKCAQRNCLTESLLSGAGE